MRSARSSTPAGADGDDRESTRRARAQLRRGRRHETIDRHLARRAETGAADRRNGGAHRWLRTAPGAIERAVPRPRTFGALAVGQA
jgi:hypothetical protein